MSLSVASTSRPNFSAMAPSDRSPDNVSAELIPENDLYYIGNLGWMRHQIRSAVPKTTMGGGNWKLSEDLKQMLRIDKKTSLEAAKVLRNEQHPCDAMLRAAIRDQKRLVMEVNTLFKEKEKEKERLRKVDLMVQQLSQSNGQLSEENRSLAIENRELKDLLGSGAKIVEGLMAEVKESKVKVKEDEDEDMYGSNAVQDDDDFVIVEGEGGEESDCDGYTVLKG